MKRLQKKPHAFRVDLEEKTEQTIDGKTFSEVFSAKEESGVVIETTKSKAENEFKIDFDPNSVAKEKKKRKVFKTVMSALSWILIIAIGGVGGYVVGDMIVGKLNFYDPNQYAGLAESAETIAQWKNQRIENLSATQVFVVAEDNLNNCDYYSIATKGYNGEDQGLIQTIITQTLSGYRYVNGDEAYFTYYSESSMVTVYQKVAYNPNGDENYVYHGQGSIGNMTWNLKPNTETGRDHYTNEEYVAMVGCEAGKPVDYVISRQTVKEESEMVKEGEVYSYTLKLNAKKAVSNYVKKMKWISGLADYPVFDSIEIDFKVDKNMNFLTIGVKESYSVNYGITASCSGSLRYYFDYDDIEKL